MPALWVGAPLAEGPVRALRWSYLIRFGLAWDLTTKTWFLFLPFGTRTANLCLPRHGVLEAHNLPGFTDLQLERNVVFFPQDKSYLKSHNI